MKSVFTITALLCTVLANLSCHKESVIIQKDPLKEDFLNNTKVYTGSYGSVDEESIFTVQRNSGKLRVTTATVQGSIIIKKFIMVSDDRQQNNPQRIIYYMECNLPISATQTEKEHFNGYLKLIPLSGGEPLKYKIQNGVKVRNSNSNIIPYITAQLVDTHWGCVSKCVNKTMNDMSWGSYILCAAALPECSAGIFLACEIDCSFK